MPYKRYSKMGLEIQQNKTHTHSEVFTVSSLRKAHEGNLIGLGICQLTTLLQNRFRHVCMNLKDFAATFPLYEHKTRAKTKYIFIYIFIYIHICISVLTKPRKLTTESKQFSRLRKAWAWQQAHIYKIKKTTKLYNKRARSLLSEGELRALRTTRPP